MELVAVIVCLYINYYQAEGIYYCYHSLPWSFLLRIRFLVLHFFTNTGVEVRWGATTFWLGQSKLELGVEKWFVLISQYISMYIISLYPARQSRHLPGPLYTLGVSCSVLVLFCGVTLYTCDWGGHCFMSEQTNIWTKIVKLADRKDNWRTNKYLSLQAVSPGVVITTSARDSH